MNKCSKKLVSLIFAVLFVFGAAHLSSFTGIDFLSIFEVKSGAYTTRYTADISFDINGKKIKRTDVGWPGADKCYIYASNMYTKIWGYSHDQSFTGEYKTNYNMLVNLSDDERKVTAANTESFMKNAELGAVVRVTNSSSTSGAFGNDSIPSKDGTYGHSFILVAKDSAGFTILESWDKGTFTHYYTFGNFASFCKYKYFKYIKWPEAPSYGRNIDYNLKNDAPTDISKSDATLSFSVSPKMAPGSWGFYLSAVESDVRDLSESCKKAVSAGTLSCAVSNFAGRLSPGRLYYYRFWAVVAGKPVNGDIDSFSTIGLTQAETASIASKFSNSLVIGSKLTEPALIGSKFSIPALIGPEDSLPPIGLKPSEAEFNPAGNLADTVTEDLPLVHLNLVADFVSLSADFMIPAEQ